MALKRREFIKIALKTTVIVGSGSIMSFANQGFALPPRSGIKLRLACVSDGHWGQPDTDYQTMHKEMNNWLIDENENRGLDLVVVNGDIIHNDFSYMPFAKAHWEKLPIPIYAVHGNHDMCTELQWNEVWNGSWHNALEMKDTVFLALNTADENGKYICPDLDWTRKQLKKYKKKKHLFVFMHITPLKWTEYGISCPELVEMFTKQNNLKAIFHGHDHDQDNMKVNEGKPYFFDAHVGGSWGTKYRGYRIVEVMNNDEIITYQLNPEAGVKVNKSNL